MKNYELDFETEITIVTAQEYMDEVDFTEQDLITDWGQLYTHYVRALVTGNDYGMRLFAPVRGDYKNSVRNAIQEVMNELLDDYYEYISSK